MRQIIYSKEFDLAAERIGYERIELALEVIIEALYKNPYGFRKFENDTTSFRWATIEGIPNCPALWLTFNILENRDVELTHVEELETYD